MLYHIFYPLAEVLSPLNIFKYITFRAAYGALTAFLICVLLGPAAIALLGRLKLRERARESVPSRHRAKAGTPSMGGLLLIFSVLVSCALWMRWDLWYSWIVLFSVCWFGAIGFWDDYLKIVKKMKKGLAAKTKFAAQILGAITIFWMAVWGAEPGDMSFSTNLPLIKVPVELGLSYVFLVILVIVGASNAVNLTDGLDGLAIGCATVTSLGFGILSYVVGHAEFSQYLNVVHIVEASELTVFCATLVGAGLGFLWFNAHPAQVFMGDTGSLFLGGTLGTVAFLTKQEFLLPLLGGIFVIEALSVIFQVASVQIFGRRLFRMTPIHHHFELAGWSESKIIVRFWIVAILFAVLTLSTLKIR